ncbi:MAG: hypothetical protein OHK0026_01840 [Rhodocyclaceae bacterium]
MNETCDLASTTVLVVDDDPAVRDAVQRLLRSVGLAAIGYASPAQLLAHVPDPPPACIVADMRMPEMNGLELHAALKAQGREVGQSLLFFGCRHPQQDFIYEDELRQFEAQGITQLVTAFSRIEGEPKCYVQDQLYRRRDEVWQMIEQGAVLYVCGDASRMAPDVRRTLGAIYREKTGADEAAAERWLNEITAQNRYLVDVWAAN